MYIGQFKLRNPLIVAPMAGVTDQPFRNQCLHFGAALAVSEMVSSNPRVWATEKSMHRMIHQGEMGIRSVQIAGAEPSLMAEAARYNVSLGAQIIDINMGCPAKKVNKKCAGSALLQHPQLVQEILRSVVEAVRVPVTLKIRTGWDLEHKNGVEIAQIAQDCGVAALAVHGRTRKDMFRGYAEYDTIKAIKASVDIPVIANGDIDSPEKARFVLDYTGADGIMIGRAAQGRPWIFREILHFLETGQYIEPISQEEQRQVMMQHIRQLHDFYGHHKGVLFARKHVGWYFSQYDAVAYRREFNQASTAQEQYEAFENYFVRSKPI
tara:strand:+ start:15807 stop:16775 length:969 start_codon:yes stop_codon:yes gene_type:complete